MACTAPRVVSRRLGALHSASLAARVALTMLRPLSTAHAARSPSGEIAALAGGGAPGSPPPRRWAKAGAVDASIRPRRVITSLRATIFDLLFVGIFHAQLIQIG